MSAPKHTAAPWLVEDRTVYALQGTGTYTGKGDDRREMMENRFYASVQGAFGTPAAELQANAHLIAAAPTAPHRCGLQDCPGDILHGPIGRLRDVYGDLPPSVQRYFNEYRAALAKAEGRSNA